MAIDFPNTPAVGQIFVAPNGVSYQWNGTLWLQVSMTGGGTASFASYFNGAVGWSGAWAPTTAQVVVAGNEGGWFVPGTGRFTPPPGRYHLYGSCTAGLTTNSTTFNIKFTKNGVDLVYGTQYTATANGMGNVAIETTVDANGTDWFDLQGIANNGTNMTGTLMWGAFPVPTPQPSPGFVGVPWRQIARVVPAANQNAVDSTNIASDINDIEISFDIVPLSNAGVL